MSEAEINIDLLDHIAPDFDEVDLDIWEGGHTYYLIKGGRGSCKSSFVSLEIIAGMMADPRAQAVVLRKVGLYLADSVFTQLQWAIDKLQVTKYWKANKSPLLLTYKPTGQMIYFRGADDPNKIKSIKPASGYFKFVWYEEFDQFDGEDEIRKINQSLLRGGDDFRVFYTFNPPKSAQNWVNAYALLPRTDQLSHHSTYSNVPCEWLGEQFFRDAESLRLVKEIAYRHEYLGEVTGTGGQVFDNIVLRAITDEEIEGFEYVYPGLDFGFTTNPCAYVECAYKRGLKQLLIFHEIYKAGLGNEALAKEIKTRLHRRTTVADSEDPRTINELRLLGVNIEAAKKGKDSVDHGIKWLQKRFEIIIDPARCPNTAKEFTGYEYEQDRMGNFKAQYPDDNNHAIDAVRYAMEKTMLTSDQPSRCITSGKYTQPIDFRRR